VLGHVDTPDAAPPTRLGKLSDTMHVAKAPAVDAPTGQLANSPKPGLSTGPKTAAAGRNGLRDSRGVGGGGVGGGGARGGSDEAAVGGGLLRPSAMGGVRPRAPIKGEDGALHRAIPYGGPDDPGGGGSARSKGSAHAFARGRVRDTEGVGARDVERDGGGGGGNEEGEGEEGRGKLGRSVGRAAGNTVKVAGKWVPGVEQLNSRDRSRGNAKIDTRPDPAVGAAQAAAAAAQARAAARAAALRAAAMGGEARAVELAAAAREPEGSAAFQKPKPPKNTNKVNRGPPRKPPSRRIEAGRPLLAEVGNRVDGRGQPGA
jgi:hypothetical protein